MKKKLKIETKQKCWSLVTGITYATVPSWYGATFRDLKCSVCMPKVRGEERFPLLVWLCGGAFKVMDTEVWWPQWIEFARKGCVVASVEYRTSNEEVFPAALCDVKTAVRYFKTHADWYGIDPDRVFVAGESAGGALAGLVGVTGSRTAGKYDVGQWLEADSSVCGVIDYYGVAYMRASDTEQRVSTDSSCITAVQGDTNSTYGAVEQFLGIEGDLCKLRTEASAVCHISEKTPPFLIFHGERDDLVDSAQSEELYRQLCSAGVQADYYLLEGEGHGADAFYQEELMEVVRQFITSDRRKP